MFVQYVMKKIILWVKGVWQSLGIDRNKVSERFNDNITNTDEAIQQYGGQGGSNVQDHFYDGRYMTSAECDAILKQKGITRAEVANY